MKELEQFDLCIIGGGVAGGILAACLGNKGLKICIIEKSFTEQERIVGELLQPGGYNKLKEMNLQHLINGIDAQQVSGYGLFMKGDHFKIPYNAEPLHNVHGYGFRNHLFVRKIRAYLQTIPSVTLTEGTVTELVEEEGRVKGVRYIPKLSEADNQVNAKLIVASDGMFSSFRQQLSENEKKVSSYFLGLVMKNCVLPFPNHGHVIVAEPSPCLIYPISSTETRILIDFPQAEAPRKSDLLNKYLLETILPQLPDPVKLPFKDAVLEGKMKVMPNHYSPAKPFRKPGALLLGDSLNMRHPLTGGGMTVALTDIKLFSDLLSEACSKTTGPETPAMQQMRFDNAVEEFYKLRHKQNATINILADALYGVMKNEELKNACYEYLKRGGVYAEEPVSLLSAVSRNRNLLLRHFFAVALFGVKNILLPYPTWKRLRVSRQMVTDAVDIVSPLVLNEKPSTLTKYTFKTAAKLF